MGVASGDDTAVVVCIISGALRRDLLWDTSFSIFLRLALAWLRGDDLRQAHQLAGDRRAEVFGRVGIHVGEIVRALGERDPVGRLALQDPADAPPGLEPAPAEPRLAGQDRPGAGLLGAEA